jgi:DNA-binding MarR family transcriptional regulator
MKVPHQPAEARPSDTSPIDVQELAVELHSRLFGIISALRRRDHVQINGQTLTQSQRSLLYVLRDGVRVPVTDLATLEGLSQKAFAGHMRILEDLGLVHRFRDLSDRRKMWVQITTKGMETQRAAAADLVELTAFDLSPSEVDALGAALALLESLAQRAVLTDA